LKLNLSEFAVNEKELHEINELNRKHNKMKNSKEEQGGGGEEEPVHISPSHVFNKTSNLGRYSLKAAVIHEGSLDHGHYYTLGRVFATPTTREEEDEKSYWVKMNDAVVSRVDEKTVLQTCRGQERGGERGRGGGGGGGSAGLIEKYLSEMNPISSNAYLLFYSLDE
jgi:hypothetical protein